jgi:DNA repair protein RadD
MQPRWYQTAGVEALWDYFRTKDGNPVLAYPTGTGKSVVIALIVEKALKEFPRTRIVKLTHVKELIQQNFDKLMEVWPLAPAGICSAGLGRRDVSYPVTYAGIGTVAKRPEVFGHIDLVIIDEAHRLSPKENTGYRKFIAALLQVNPHLRVIGLTATPYRLGQGSLTDDGLFTDVCYDLTGYEAFNRLLAEGYLCPLVPRRPNREIDVSSVRITAGDFNEHDLQLASDREEITRHAVDEIMAQGSDRGHWLIFTSGVEHANHVAAEIRGRGVSVTCIHSKLTKEERDEGIAGWKSGKYRCAVNNDVLSTGIDFPGIDLIGMLRATTSPSKWVQMLGRGTRPCPGKTNCLVLDFAGNTRRLGTIDDPRIPVKKGKAGKGEAPCKCCPKCDTWNHASVRFCTCCGQAFPPKVKFKERSSDLELMSSAEPVVEVFDVTEVTYQVHVSRFDRSKPPSLKVTYFCGIRAFSQWVCFEHTGLALHKAHDWWRERVGDEDIPATVEAARKRIDEARVPTQLRVWVNTKYPEILAVGFEGAPLV